MLIKKRLLLPASLVLILLGITLGSHYEAPAVSTVYGIAPIGLGSSPAPAAIQGSDSVTGLGASLSLPSVIMVADPNNLPIARGKTDGANGRSYPYWFTYYSHPFYIINDSQAYDPNFVGNNWPRLVPRDAKYMGDDGGTIVWRAEESDGSLSSHLGLDINAYRAVNSYYTDHWVILGGAAEGVGGCLAEGAAAEIPIDWAVTLVKVSWCGAAGAFITFISPEATPTLGPTSAPTPGPTPLPGPTPAPPAQPTPVPTAKPTPMPTAVPTPMPTAVPTPVPTAKPTPVPTAVPTPTPQPPTPTPVGSDRLCCNSYMFGGAALTSQNGGFSLVMQSDGNLVLYNNVDGIGACWSAAGAFGHRGDVVTMQSDGNLVIYSSQTLPRSVIWASNTGNHSQQNYFALVQNDGNFVIYSQDGSQALWATATNKSRSQGGCQ